MRQILLTTAVLVFIAVAVGQAQTTLTASTTAPVREVECKYVPGMYLGSRQRELECCNETSEHFEGMWASGELHLTRYLSTLQAWKCPQLANECQKPTFAFNEFTTLVYDYFCNHTRLVTQCASTVAQVVEGHLQLSVQPTNATAEGSGAPVFTQNEAWQIALREMQVLPLSEEDLVKPCVQVALFDAETDKFNNYHEIVHADVPACDVIWCGIDGEAIRNTQINAWVCMKPSCRSGIIAIMVFCVLLAIITTVANLTVIVVILRNPSIRHSQSIYKLSIAFGDILVGLIVFPTFVSTLAKIALTNITHGSYQEVEGYENYTNGTVGTELVTFLYRETGGKISDILGTPYLNFVGFFTTLSLLVSIYSLTVAGFDRLTAVYRPLRYRKDRAKLLAKQLCVVVWVCALVFSTFPFYIPGLQYALVSSFLISMGGTEALILYAVVFVIPLVIMWVVSIATYHSTRKHAQARRHLTKDSKSKTRSVENRLARTLSLMVGAFTLSFLPAAVVLIASLFPVSIYFSQPKLFSLSAASAFKDVEFVTVLIVMCNSLWNFFIYNARNLEFRRCVRVMYKDFAEKTRLALCWDSTVLCSRRVVHEGARRFSNIPTLTTNSGGRKKSLASTEVTTMSQLRRESNAATNQTSSRGVFSTELKSTDASHSSTQDSVSKTNLESTSLAESEATRAYKPKYAKNPKIKGKKGEESVTDDSIFNSFAIDANADRLFVSVMENIDEDIEAAGGAEKYEDTKA